MFCDWCEWCSTELLNASYQQWCRQNGVRSTVSRELLGKRMRDIGCQPHRAKKMAIVGEVEVLHYDAEGNANHTILSNRPGGYHLGPMQEAIERFAKKRGVTIDLPTDEEVPVDIVGGADDGPRDLDPGWWAPELFDAKVA